ncbi:MAG TPA: MFS transporter [bacterium]
MVKQWRTWAVVLVAATLVISLSVGIRATLGLFLRPMTLDLGWGRETFALAIALQNLLWGAAQPFTGMLADRYGTGRVIAFGGLGYALGLLTMGLSTTPGVFTFGVAVLNGLGISACSFAVVLGAVGRAVPEHRRSMAMGIASAGGSIGQFVMLPVGQALISTNGWSVALMYLAGCALVMVPVAMMLTGRAAADPGTGKAQPGKAFVSALSYRQYWLMFTGFFVCGFHVAFIGTHLPAYLVDNKISPAMGATALALIGFFNILGSFAFGVLGGRYSKKKTLAGLYLARSVAIAFFVFTPISNASVLIFASSVGFLWLGTVPLTSSLVGQIFGVKYLSTLFGFVFFGHQIGSFLGVWMGGWVFDTTGSYNPVWYAGIALGIFAAIVHWPIDERTVEMGKALGADPVLAGR